VAQWQPGGLCYPKTCVVGVGTSREKRWLSGGRAACATRKPASLVSVPAGLPSLASGKMYIKCAVAGEVRDEVRGAI